jgi:anaerobic magnesium-protoporphyrin IX monomethyl ester cyclase
MRGKTHWQESNDLEMMFQGTYTSDFYRTVRNLMHDQVTLQTLDMAAGGDEHIAAKRTLDQRWRELLNREFQYRSPVGSTAAAG